LPGGYDEPRTIAFFEELRARLETLPGVRSATAVNSAPISDGDSHGGITVEGQPPSTEILSASYRRILPNYFRTMGIPLLAGREFDARDGKEPYSVIINESFAKQYFPRGDAIGHRIKIGPPENEPWLTVVGVVADVRNESLDREPGFATYEPHAQRPWTQMNVTVRAAGDPVALLATVRSQVRSMERQIVITNATTMEQRIANSVAPRRFQLILLGTFAGLAVLLAAVGIYGVVAYNVAQQTREIGIRMALGAQPRDVLSMVLGRTAVLLAGGIALGLLGALTLTPLLRDSLFGIAATDAVTFAALSALLMLVGLAATYVPARRAARVDPLVALRYE
jgi:putative ABC transport system permease protein